MNSHTEGNVRVWCERVHQEFWVSFGGCVLQTETRLALVSHSAFKEQRRPVFLCRIISAVKWWGALFCQVVHEIRNYPYPQLHLLALQSLNPSRHATAVRESYEVNLSLNTSRTLSSLRRSKPEHPCNLKTNFETLEPSDLHFYFVN